jgi:DNA modification methylase
MTDSLIEQLSMIVAAGKKEAEDVLARVKDARGCSLQVDEYLFSKGAGREIPEQNWFNRLLYGDNLILMETLLAGDQSTGLPSLKGKIDLIYIDPPFASRVSYKTSFTLPDANGEKPFVLKQQAYNDSWRGGLASYLRMLYPRLFLMRELLSENGSLFIHLDWHAVHYVKVLLDELFGPENFRNEIAWCYGGGGAPRKTYPRKHDLLLWYTKGSCWTFNRQYRPYTQGTLERGLTAVKGDRYRLRSEGAGLDDWWAGKDVQKILSPTAFENLKFSTQKPEGLLKRIILGHSNEGDLVADFFCGTGTTAAVAERLGRRWIAADINKQAVMIAYQRLVRAGGSPFICQSPRDYHKALLQRSSIREGNDNGLSRSVLDLFGARPLAEGNHAVGALGYLENTRTLVVVVPPDQPLTISFLRDAQELQGSLQGEWNSVVVLGWELAPGVIDTIKEWKEEAPEILLIQSELLEEMELGVKPCKLSPKNGLYFSSPRCLALKAPVIREISPEQEEIIVELDDYSFLAPTYLPVNAVAGEKVWKLLERDPLALIEYWSIDPNYNGRIFCSSWWGMRGNRLRVCPQARLLIPRVRGTRKIAVKAVDVFGYESMVVAAHCNLAGSGGNGRDQ